jgi:putative membrane protein
MIQFFLHCLLYALSFMLAAKVVPGITVRSFSAALVFAAVFAILDGLLFKLLAFVTLPLVIITFGLFLFCIRAGLFLAADKFVDGVKIDGFVAALLGSLLTGGINWLINRFVNIS